MRKFVFGSIAFAAFSGSMMADSIWSGSVGFLNTIPSSITQPTFTGALIGTNTQSPFWNNPSADTINSHTANVGAVLSGLTTGTNLIGSNLSAGVVNGSYFAFNTTDNASGGGDPAAVSSGTSASPGLAFSFLSSATAYNIAVLFADSSNNTGSAATGGTVFGYYTGSGGSFTAHPIGGPLSNNTTGTASSLATNDVLQPNNFVYGFYATVCYDVTAGVCDESVTYTTGAGNFSTNMSAGNQFLGSLGWQHFALFQLASGELVLAFEDTPWALGGPNSNEGIGDFNDVIIGLTSAAAVPEPGTMAFIGLGLAGLGLVARRRFAKK